MSHSPFISYRHIIFNDEFFSHLCLHLFSMPSRSHTMSKLSRVIKFIFAIWILAFLLAAPQAFQFGLVHSGSSSFTTCTVSFNCLIVNPTQLIWTTTHPSSFFSIFSTWTLNKKGQESIRGARVRGQQLCVLHSSDDSDLCPLYPHRHQTPTE